MPPPSAAVPITELSAGSASPSVQDRRIGFSYIRVSSERQAGETRSGLDRQADQFLPFCERHGLTPSLDPLVDAGISAYRGSNRRRGALGQFLSAARDGLVSGGAVLVVEDLDRFSREAPSYAEEQLAEMFRLGLALGIVRDDVVIDRALYDSDIGVRLQLLVRRDAAHDYSRKLSARVSAAHERIRSRERQGEMVNIHWKPQWLDYDPEAGTFTVNDRWPMYRRILDLCLEGYGQTRVAAMVNGEGHRNSHGGLWSGASVAQVWRDRRLIGERIYGRGRSAEVEILPGYFPAMITTAEWQRLQESVAQRRSKRGRVGRGEHRHNILQGMVFCTCGMRRELHVAAKPSGRKHAYLVCKSKIRGRRVGAGTCSEKNVPYDELWLLQALMGQRWQQYFNRPEDNRQRREIERELLNAETLLAKHQQAQQNAEANLQTLLSSGALEPDDAALLLKLAKDARRQAEATEAVVRGHRERLQQVMARPSGAEMEKAIRDRVEAFMATDRHDPTERVRFNTWLTTLGIRVIISRSGDRVQMSVEPLVKATYDGAGGVTVAGAELVVQAPR